MRVRALTFGDPHTGSSQYRIYQFVEPLRARGVEFIPTPTTGFTAWDELANYDAVLVQKKLHKAGIVQRLRQRSRRLIYDVDDEIWQPHGKKHFWLTTWRTRRRLGAIARAADLCLAANSVLAAELLCWSQRVVVLPMALDETPWFPRADRPAGRPVRIGWAGHPVNLGYLEGIEPALLAIQREEKGVEFAIFCGQRPKFRELPYEFNAFTPGAEPDAIRGFDIGLLPLPDNPFAGGKSPIKGLQYMACGVPCVASPIGATREIFGAPPAALFARTIAEWTASVRVLLDPARRGDMGKHARQVFEKHYALSSVAAKFSELLLNLRQ